MSEHTPLNSENVISVSNAIFRKRISVYQVLFLRAGYQATAGPAQSYAYDKPGKVTLGKYDLSD